MISDSISDRSASCPISRSWRIRRSARSWGVAVKKNLYSASGSISLSGTTGLTLTEGQYLVVFETDASVANSGTIAAALSLGGNALPYAASFLAKTGSNNNERIGLAAILNLASTQTLTVKNTSTDTNTHANSTLNVVKLA